MTDASSRLDPAQKINILFRHYGDAAALGISNGVVVVDDDDVGNGI